jgi:hypothetical protein
MCVVNWIFGGCLDWIGTEAARKDDGKEGIDESVKGNQVHSLGNLHVEFPEMEICELDSLSQCSSQREFFFLQQHQR